MGERDSEAAKGWGAHELWGRRVMHAGKGRGHAPSSSQTHRCPSTSKMELGREWRGVRLCEGGVEGWRALLGRGGLGQYL